MSFNFYWNIQQLYCNKYFFYGNAPFPHLHYIFSKIFSAVMPNRYLDGGGPKDLPRTNRANKPSAASFVSNFARPPAVCLWHRSPSRRRSDLFMRLFSHHRSIPNNAGSSRINRSLHFSYASRSDMIFTRRFVGECYFKKVDTFTRFI